MKCKHEGYVLLASWHFWCPNCGAHKLAYVKRWTYPKIWRTAQKKKDL